MSDSPVVMPVAAETRRDAGLDLIRGLAVVAVVVHHAATLAGPERSGWLGTPAVALDAGVAVFFVLSGYLIYRPFVVRRATGDPAESLRGFWWRRALRVLPAYWLALGTFLVLGVIEPTGFTDLLSHITLLNVFRPGSLFNGISQGWSLTVELTFYASVPFWAYLLRRGGGRDRRCELIGIALLVALAHLFRIAVYSVDWTIQGASLRGMSYLWLPSHLDLLAAGMAIAVLSVHGAPGRLAVAVRGLGRSRAASWVFAGAILLTYAYTVGGPSIAAGYTLWHLELRQLVYGLVGVLLVAAVVFRDESTRPAVPSTRTGAWWCGALSYGVYLFHNDLMEFVTRRVGAGNGPRWMGEGLANMAFWPLLGVGLIGGVAAALLSWFLVESPSRRLRGWMDDGVPFWMHLSPRARTATALTMLAVVVALPVRGLMRYQGPPMEEGFMLAFPEQLLAGRLPHRDFLHLYGPGSLWTLAGLYRVFGTSLTLERLVGLAQHVGVALGLFVLLRPFGRRIATIGAAVSVIILISPLGLSAMAWNGALASAVCALALATRASARPDSATSRRMLITAGVLAGVALLYRPDLVVAVSLGLGAVALKLQRSRRRPLMLATFTTLLLYVPHVLTSGIDASFRGMFLEPVFELRAGRSLPVPPSVGEVDGFLQRAGEIRVVGWPFPMPPTSVQINLWFWLVLCSCAGALGLGWRARRRGSATALVLWPAGLFSAALVTQAVQRPDTAHLSWVTGITFPVVIAGLYSVLGERPGARQPSRRAWQPARRAWIASAPVMIVLVAIIPFYPVRTYADLVTQSAGFNQFGFEIRRDDRVFYYGSEQAAADAQAVTDRLAAISKPNDRVIVSPMDLSKTPYSDAFFYYLFPELIPGTRYIEMDPGIADAPDSGLADELRTSDWLIRSRAWDGWDEPNDSRFPGSNEPNEVVAEMYCMELDAGTFQLLRRCRP